MPLQPFLGPHYLYFPVSIFRWHLEDFGRPNCVHLSLATTSCFASLAEKFSSEAFEGGFDVAVMISVEIGDDSFVVMLLDRYVTAMPVELDRYA